MKQLWSEAGIDHVVIADHLAGFLEMKITWVSLRVKPIPIIYSISRVRVLLNLENKAPFPNSMKAATWDEDHVSFFNGDCVHHGEDISRGKIAIDDFLRVVVIESCIDHSIFCGIEDVPGFGFCFATINRGACVVGVDLDAEVVVGINELEEKGKSVG